MYQTQGNPVRLTGQHLQYRKYVACEPRRQAVLNNRSFMMLLLNTSEKTNPGVKIPDTAWKQSKPSHTALNQTHAHVFALLGH